MNSRSRQKRILEHLQEHPILTVGEIVELIECSPATIRRDIIELDEQGKLKKIRNLGKCIAVNLALVAEIELDASSAVLVLQVRVFHK